MPPRKGKPLTGQVLEANPGRKKRRQPKAKSGPEMVRRTLQQRQTLELRRSGMTINEIGMQIGRDKSTVFRYLEAALADVREEIRQTADKLRELELSRLEKLLFGLWGTAIGGDVPAVLAVLKVLERRAKLLGLDVTVIAVPREVPFEAAMTQAIGPVAAGIEDLSTLTEAQLASRYRQRVQEGYESKPKTETATVIPLQIPKAS